MLVPGRWSHRTWRAKDDNLRRATSILCEHAASGKPLSATEGARRAGCSRSTWAAYVRRARAAGWLVQHTERTGRGGWMSTSRFSVQWTQDLAAQLSERWRIVASLAWACLRDGSAREADLRRWCRWSGQGPITRMTRALHGSIRSQTRIRTGEEGRVLTGPKGPSRTPECARTRGLPSQPAQPPIRGMGNNPELLWRVERAGQRVGERRPGSVMAQLDRLLGSEPGRRGWEELVGAYERSAAEVAEAAATPGLRSPVRQPAALACWRLRREWARRSPGEGVDSPRLVESYCPNCGGYHAGADGATWAVCPEVGTGERGSSVAAVGADVSPVSPVEVSIRSLGILGE